MAKMKYEPELGQILFGNPMGKYTADWASNDLFEISEAIEPDDDSPGYGQEFENDVFVMNRYYWGEEEEEAIKPNFLHKPSGLEIRWYKYIGRGMSATQTKPENWKHIVVECLDSIPPPKPSRRGRK